MRAVIQRVTSASVTIEGKVNGAIDTGLLILLGIESEDVSEDAAYLAQKICALRIFADEAGLMNLSLEAVGGGLLIISQFTLHALTKKGNRPSFIRAARPEVAIPLYEYFLQQAKSITGKEPATGIFGADMQVALINDGPVTIIIDSKARE